MAGMTKRHFEAHAHIINTAYHADQIDRPTVEAIAVMLADYYEQENPLFNRMRFAIACFDGDQPS